MNSSKSWCRWECNTIDIIWFRWYFGRNISRFHIRLQQYVSMYLFGHVIICNSNAIYISKIRRINIHFEYAAIVFAGNISEWTVCTYNNIGKCWIGSTQLFGWKCQSIGNCNCHNWWNWIVGGGSWSLFGWFLFGHQLGACILYAHHRRSISINTSSPISSQRNFHKIQTKSTDWLTTHHVKRMSINL